MLDLSFFPFNNVITSLKLKNVNIVISQYFHATSEPNLMPNIFETKILGGIIDSWYLSWPKKISSGSSKVLLGSEENCVTVAYHHCVCCYVRQVQPMISHVRRNCLVQLPYNGSFLPLPCKWTSPCLSAGLQSSDAVNCLYNSSS